MGRRRSKLKDYEGYKITFQYDGPDHPNSKIGSQKITGTIIHVGIDTFKINIYQYPDTTLTISDIVDGTIKKKI